MKITEPGFYPDMTEADYRADCCPVPSLTQSIAKILLDRSPLHAWHAHPRLNPDFRPDDDTKFDVGNIAHKLMIRRGKDIVVLEFDDWRTKAAKEARDVAASCGKLAVLGKHFAKADRMVKSAREQLQQRNLGRLFTEGSGELCLAWQEGDIWLRQLIDWLTPNRRTFVDYKTTDMSAAAHGLGRMMVNAGWPVQAAMADRGLNVLDKWNAGRRRFLFVVQEAEPPYLLNVVELSDDAMTMGHKQLQMAVDRWTECVVANRWPGYPLEIVVPEYPGWHEQQFLDREIAEAGRARMPKREPMLMDMSGG